MRVVLLGSTVAGGLLAQPAMAADPIKIGVGGYYVFYALAGNISSQYGYVNGTSTQYKGLMFQQEGEIHFTGRSKLDNGTTVGVVVELEGWNRAVATNGSPRQIDEAYLFAFGEWGRIEFGARDMASFRMYYGTPSALPSWGFVNANTSFNWASGTMINNPSYRGVQNAALGHQFQDANRINYFTPRFMGLQIGVGYAPKMNLAPGPSVLAPRLTSGPRNNTAGVCGYNEATSASNCPTNDNSWQNVVDISANYLNKFGEVVVALYGGFLYGSFVPALQFNSTGVNLATGANLTSWKQWAIGTQFGYGGFTLGGSIGYDNNGLGGNYYTGVDNDSRKYTAGIMYETGAWAMSLGWGGTRNAAGNGLPQLTAIAQGTSQALTMPVAGNNALAFGNQYVNGSLTFGSTAVDKFEVGVNYSLGTGIKVALGGIYWNAVGPTNAVVGESWAILMGMDLRF
ncbi:MAG: porin [Enhydrobacter sp.]|nr:porin [Enhydrobacter sp.]